MYQEYLAEFWYSSKALESSKVSFSIPIGDVVRKWFPTIGYGEEVSTKGTLKKSLLPPRWRLLMAQIIQCLGGKTGGCDQITNKDTIMLYSLANGIHIDYAYIFWEHIILKLKKKQRESVNNWTLKPNQLEEPPFTAYMLAICALDKPVVFKAPNDSIPPQQDQTKSVSKGLETVLTQPTIEKGASSIAIHGDKEEASTAIHDDPVIIVDESDEDEPNAKTEDTPVPRSSSPRSSQIQELTNQVLILQSQKHKLELEKNKAEAKAALLKAQPSFLNVEQLNKLLVKSLQTEFSKIFSSHDFSSSLPTELKDLPSKFNELTEEIKGLKTQVYELEIELPEELIEIPTKLEDFTMTTTSLTSHVAELKTLHWELPEEFISLTAKVESAQAKLKSLDALPSLLLNVTKALNKFTEVLESTSIKARDHSVLSAGQADTMPAEGEKDTNQATISQLFQRRAEKIAEAKKENLNQQPKPTTPPTTTPINPPIITTTTQMQTPLQSPPRSSSQPEGEHIKKDKGKKVMSSEEAEKESTESDSNDEAHMTGSMVDSSKVKNLKKFDFFTESGEHVHLTKEQISVQKKIEEEAKAEAARREGEIRKEELIDLLCVDVDPLEKLNDLENKKRKHDDDIHDYFKANKRLKSSVQYEDHLPSIVLNEHVLGMIMFNSYHRQDFVTIEDLKDFSNTMLYIVQEIFFKHHQGLGLDDHARTFSSLLLAKVDKRNLNPHKQMRTIEQLSQ
ncbi:hypothetical protein Tco_0974878 [Tanacetum coccineum]|uniref:Aminotransferase-like plant mobile domain-containing protein n=1 Tax=Tanacetum coccineum TaxID=301880 RepID=A0ABQ5ECS1_9ASTR